MESGLKQHLAQSLVHQVNKRMCEPIAETHALSVSGCFRITYAHVTHVCISRPTPASGLPPGRDPKGLLKGGRTENLLPEARLREQC